MCLKNVFKKCVFLSLSSQLISRKKIPQQAAFFLFTYKN